MHNFKTLLLNNDDLKCFFIHIKSTATHGFTVALAMMLADCFPPGESRIVVASLTPNEVVVVALTAR